MGSLADEIERHIKELFEQGTGDVVEIRRIELAGRFACVPSQINYVLETRFTPQRGYAVESRRGGGGFIRIVRLHRVHAVDRREMLWSLVSQVGTSIGARESDELVERLEALELIGAHEAAVWRMAIRRQARLVPPLLRDQVRAALLRGLMLVRFTGAMQG